jgi:hypothetical protein
MIEHHTRLPGQSQCRMQVDVERLPRHSGEDRYNGTQRGCMNVIPHPDA